MNIVFSESRPSMDLAPFVQAYWFGNFNVTGEKDFMQTVVPNACIELIIHLSDTHCLLNKQNGFWGTSPAFTLLGMHTKTYNVKFCTNVQVFGIRFYPDGIRNIFGIAPSEFLSSFEDGVDVAGKSLNDFCRQLRETKFARDQVNQADEYLLQQLSAHYQPGDYTHKAMRLIRKRSGTESYAALVDMISISDRQLQREFRNLYGITVRDYMRLVRINAVQKHLQSGMCNLTRLSYDLAFSDQSHFIREFKNYIGLPPKKFLRNRERYIVNSFSDETDCRV